MKRSGGEFQAAVLWTELDMLGFFERSGEHRRVPRARGVSAEREVMRAAR